MADLRRCIGSTKFGIEAHDAPPEDFPVQPSQKDGLGRMCKEHWRAYTTALRKAALARTVAPDGAASDVAPTGSAPPAVAAGRRAKGAAKPEPIRTRAPRPRRTQPGAAPPVEPTPTPAQADDPGAPEDALG